MRPPRELPSSGGDQVRGHARNPTPSQIGRGEWVRDSNLVPSATRTPQQNFFEWNFSEGRVAHSRCQRPLPTRRCGSAPDPLEPQIVRAAGHLFIAVAHPNFCILLYSRRPSVGTAEHH